MYSLLRLLPLRRLLGEQVPALAVSVIVAEVFYKFHSFTLECLAFLATWAVTDALIQLVARRMGVAGESGRPRALRLRRPTVHP